MTGKTKNNIQLIDLGLPSGTLWADRNVGADLPEGYGDYFRFGEATPFTEDSQPYKYDKIECDIAGTDRDAATAILGEQFRMPTLEQVKELIDKCSREWTEVGGVKGTKVTGPNGNSVFFPAAGYRNYSDGFINGVGFKDFCWSSSHYRRNNGCSLFLSSDIMGWYYFNRADGFSVRAVKR